MASLTSLRLCRCVLLYSAESLSPFKFSGPEPPLEFAVKVLLVP